MAHEEKLPWELTEEILSRVPPRSLVRFRTVSKQWNTLFNDKTFINNHKSTAFRFILSTKSSIYSVSINPEIEVRELTLDIPGLESKIPYKLVDCNEFIVCGMDKGTLIWNPWLRQIKWIKSDHVNQPRLYVTGIGKFDGSSYKALGSYRKKSNSNGPLFWKVGDFDSNVWNSNELESDDTTTTQGGENSTVLRSPSVSLDGNSYWVANSKRYSMFFLVRYDFSTEVFYIYGNLPYGNNHDEDALVLGVFKGDRLSFLKQCHLSKKIEIWVTKNKIHHNCGKNLEWMNIMEVSIPNLPYLQPKPGYHPSYFIEDKRFVVCSLDESDRAWIYVFEDKKLISKTKLDLVVDPLPLHCTYFPNLVSVPGGHREEMELDV